MKSTHASNIFTLTFSKDNKRVFSAGNDGILIVHDVETGNEITSFDGSCFYSISLRVCRFIDVILSFYVISLLV